MQASLLTSVSQFISWNLYWRNPIRQREVFFVLCSKGSLKTIINHTEYRIRANELIALPPESFVQLLTASDDVEIHAVMFSQQLIQNAGMGKNMMDKFHIIGKHYVFPAVGGGFHAICGNVYVSVAPL